MEIEVLAGAAALLRRCQPVLYVENNCIKDSPALIQFISTFNYSLYWDLQVRAMQCMQKVCHRCTHWAHCTHWALQVTYRCCAIVLRRYILAGYIYDDVWNINALE